MSEEVKEAKKVEGPDLERINRNLTKLVRVLLLGVLVLSLLILNERTGEE